MRRIGGMRRITLACGEAGHPVVFDVPAHRSFSLAQEVRLRLCSGLMYLPDGGSFVAHRLRPPRPGTTGLASGAGMTRSA
jgi:hypothetical protein